MTRILSDSEFNKYWTIVSMQVSSEAEDNEMNMFFKTHIISSYEATYIWKNRDKYDWCVYHTPSEKTYNYYYEYFKQGKVKNPIIKLISKCPRTVAQILKQNNDHFNQYNFVDNRYYFIAFTMYEIIKDLLIPENVQILTSPLNDKLYVCRYVDENGKKIYLRNKNNINEFENKEDIYIQIYKLLFDRIYKKTQNT